jgi:nitroreductase
MRVTPSINPQTFVEQSDAPAKIRFLLEYAHLAPSTHNVQPWLFEVSESTCRISYDPQLSLPQGDVAGRDLYISLGCCLENLITAARYFGVYKDTVYHDGPGQLVAEVAFQNLDNPPEPDTKLRPLLDAILQRFNARGVFKSQALPADFAANLTKLNQSYGPEAQLHAVTEPKDRVRLAELTAEGLRRAYHRPAFRAEIAGWIRPNFSRSRDGIPGYSLRMPTPISMIMPWLMRNFDIGSKLAVLNRLSLGSAPLICVFTTAEPAPVQYVKAGQLAERVMLEANAVGMKTSIFVASVEIDELYQDVQQVIGSQRRPVFLLCAGYIDTPQGHTPRQPLESRIK